MKRRKDLIEQKIEEDIVTDYPDEYLEPGLVMDGTAHSQISLMRNIKYSREIIRDVRKAYDPGKLAGLKGDREAYLREAERQIKKIWHGVEALTAHTSLFTVLFLIAMGTVLIEVESSCEKKAEYTKWIRDNFGDGHMRYFQQAKELARMGDFGRRFASLGKNRVLEIGRLRKALDKESCDEVLSEYPQPQRVSDAVALSRVVSEMSPFPDTSADFDGELLKEHVDAILTYHRLKSGGIEFATFDQAATIASYEKHPIEAKKVTKIKAWLDEQGDADKRELFDQVIRNKMSLQTDQPRSVARGSSLNKLLADLVEFGEEAELENDAWIGNQRQIIDEEIFARAYRFLTVLAGKMGICLTTH